MSQSVKWGFTLVDDYQPGTGLNRFSGHISRRINYQTGASNYKKVAMLRVPRGVSQSLPGQGLTKVNHTGNQPAATGAFIPAGRAIHLRLTAIAS